MNDIAQLQDTLGLMMGKTAPTNGELVARGKISRLTFKAMMKAQRETCTCEASAALRQASDLLMEDVPEGD